MFRLPFMGRQRPISPLPAPRREAVEPTVDRISPDIDKGWHALANLPFRGKVVSTQVGCGRRSMAEIAESRQPLLGNGGSRLTVPLSLLGRADEVIE